MDPVLPFILWCLDRLLKLFVVQNTVSYVVGTQVKIKSRPQEVKPGEKIVGCKGKITRLGQFQNYFWGKTFVRRW